MATGQTLNNFASRIALSTAVYQAGWVGAREIAGIRSVGIEKIEISSVPPSFDYHNQEQVDEILAACQNEGVSVVAMHGPFKLPYRNTEEIEQVIEESLRALNFAIRAEGLRRPLRQRRSRGRRRSSPARHHCKRNHLPHLRKPSRPILDALCRPLTGDLVFEDGRGEDPKDWVNYVATFPQRYEEKYG
jgi:hypothetical protein